MKQRLMGLWLAALTLAMVPTIAGQVQQLVPNFPALTRSARSAPSKSVMGSAKPAFDQWKKGAPKPDTRRSKATLAERMDALEALASDHQFKLQFIKILDYNDPNFGHIYSWMFNGVRMHVNSSYWGLMPAGQGAGFSIGDDFDHYAIYAEKEGTQHFTGGASVTAAFFNFAQGPNDNHAVETVANGSFSGNNYGLVSMPISLFHDGNGRIMKIIPSAPGQQLVGINDWFIGHSNADAKRIYP